jgi:hypothetical protein
MTEEIAFYYCPSCEGEVPLDDLTHGNHEDPVMRHICGTRVEAIPKAWGEKGKAFLWVSLVVLFFFFAGWASHTIYTKMGGTPYPWFDGA